MENVYLIAPLDIKPVEVQQAIIYNHLDYLFHLTGINSFTEEISYQIWDYKSVVNNVTHKLFS